MSDNLQVKYKIIEIDPTQHSIVVRFYTDKISENDLAISYLTDENGNSILQTRNDGSPARCQTDYNINIWQTPAPTEEELKQIISLSAPYDWFKLKHSILDPTIDTSLSNVVSLLDKEFIAIKPESIIILDTANTISNTTTVLTEDEIDQLINQLMQSQANSQNTVVNTV